MYECFASMYICTPSGLVPEEVVNLFVWAGNQTQESFATARNALNHWANSLTRNLEF